MRRMTRIGSVSLVAVFAWTGGILFGQSPASPLGLPIPSLSGTALPEADSAQGPTHSSTPAGDGPVLRSENCLVKTIQNVRVPAGAEGRVTELLVSEGVNVQPGDILAKVDDTQAQLTLKLREAEEREAEINALNDVNFRDAKNSEKSATAEAEAYKELRREGAVPYWEMEKKILEADRATLRIELAQLQQDIAKVQYVAKRSERQLAEHELTRRSVVAPFAGYVETRISQLGEWVQAGTPILQLVQLDKLRVEGDIDALSYAGQIGKGTPAKVLIYTRSQRSADAESTAIALDAKVGFLGSEIDLNHRCRIWVEIENRQVGDDWLFKPGMEADILVFPPTRTK